MLDRLTDEQIGVVFRTLTAMEPRQADLQILRIAGGSPDDVAEYIWDHCLGEPEDPSLDQVTRQVRRVIATF